MKRMKKTAKQILALALAALLMATFALPAYGGEPPPESTVAADSAADTETANEAATSGSDAGVEITEEDPAGLASEKAPIAGMLEEGLQSDEVTATLAPQDGEHMVYFKLTFSRLAFFNITYSLDGENYYYLPSGTYGVYFPADTKKLYIRYINKQPSGTQMAVCTENAKLTDITTGQSEGIFEQHLTNAAGEHLPLPENTTINVYSGITVPDEQGPIQALYPDELGDGRMRVDTGHSETRFPRFETSAIYVDGSRLAMPSQADYAPDASTVSLWLNADFLASLDDGEHSIVVKTWDDKYRACIQQQAVFEVSSGLVTGRLEVPISSLTFRQEKEFIAVGGSRTLKLEHAPFYTTENTAVSWSSSNPGCVSVDENGAITAIAAGEATITATMGSQTATCPVLVTQQPVPLESLSLSQNNMELSLDPYTTGKLEVTYHPANTTVEREPYWHVQNPGQYATTIWSAKDGIVMPCYAGEAVVSASVNGIFDTCNVVVNAGPRFLPGRVHLAIGEAADLADLSVYPGLNPSTVIWEISNPAVATVSDGRVQALSVGSAYITATQSNGIVDYCTVEVGSGPVESIRIADNIERTIIYAEQGRPRSYNALTTPYDAAGQPTWSSSDPSVLTVLGNGLFVPSKIGTAEVTVEQGGKQASCTVYVFKIAPTNVKLDKSSAALLAGDSLQLHVAVEPAESTLPVFWQVTSSSPSEGVITVSDDGTVTAVSAGTATVEVSSGFRKATCTITVTETDVPVQSITLNKTAFLQAGGTTTLTATVLPSNATGSLTWRSSNTAVATVANGVVTGKAGGTAQIYAEQGGKQAVCTVTVTPPYVFVLSITLNRTSATLQAGDTTTLAAAVSPADATGTLAWRSSNPAIATVENGVVTAKAAGTAQIYAVQGGKEAVCTVTVTSATVAVQSITLNKTAANLQVGDTTTLAATVSPADATGALAWRSSNTAVATVENGVVTAKAAGTAQIYAEQGGRQAVCAVNVTARPDENTPPEEIFQPKDGVEALVYRTYKATLNREPDNGGFAYWTDRLRGKSLTGADLVEFFFLSAEFAQGSYSNEVCVERVYQAMMGRASDTSGKAYWVGLMADGQSIAAVIRGFLGSEEFAGLCAAAGVEPGSLPLTEARDRSPDLTRFVGRLYTEVLGRQWDSDGLNHWCTQALDNGYTAHQLAANFVFSDEFTQQNHDNGDYVVVLYRAFMGRQPEAEGYAYWVGQLDTGAKNRCEVFDWFASSPEFQQIAQSFGVRIV